MSTLIDDASARGSREAAIWEGGYAAGYRHAMGGRPSLVAGVFPQSTDAQVVDIWEWLLKRRATL